MTRRNLTIAAVCAGFLVIALLAGRRLYLGQTFTEVQSSADRFEAAVRVYEGG